MRYRFFFWSALVLLSLIIFVGIYYIPPSSKLDEMTPAIDSSIAKPFAVDIAALGVGQVSAGSTITLSFTITNDGMNADTFTLSPKSNVTWANLITIPASISLANGANTTITLSVAVPPNATVGTKGIFDITATSHGNPRILDEGITRLTVVPFNK